MPLFFLYLFLSFDRHPWLWRPCDDGEAAHQRRTLVLVVPLYDSFFHFWTSFPAVNDPVYKPLYDRHDRTVIPLLDI